MTGCYGDMDSQEFPNMSNVPRISAGGSTHVRRSNTRPSTRSFYAYSAAQKEPMQSVVSSGNIVSTSTVETVPTSKEKTKDTAAAILSVVMTIPVIPAGQPCKEIWTDDVIAVAGLLHGAGGRT